MLLENYQTRGVVDGDSDLYASDLYGEICNAEMDTATPRLKVQVALRLRNGKSLTENIPFEVAESEFTNLRVLVEHYLTEYPVLHLSADEGTYIRAAVVKTEEITHAEITAIRVEINDEDIRRTKFTAGEPSTN